MHMIVNRSMLVKKAQNRPANKIRLYDVRGHSGITDRPDEVIFVDGDRAFIMKDRDGVLMDLERDADGMVRLQDIMGVLAALSAR